MKAIFACPKCKTVLDLFRCPKCGYGIPQVHSIWQFCDAPAIQLDGGDKYIGYDNIGENFEPAVKYWDANNTERYGVYESCGDRLAAILGHDGIALDLGAGLGTASIPLAQNGIFTIAGDISNVMLATAVKRAGGRYANLICARMNAYDIPLTDHSVDIVIENAMLHLVSDPEKVIREIVRVLKPEGQLVRYGSYAQPLSEDEAKQNAYCNSVLSDISDVFYDTLKRFGYESIWFDNHFADVILKYFEKPCNEAVPGFSEIFTDKLKFRLHRLKTGAHSDLQNTPREWIDAAWRAADRYAVQRYGEDYFEIKGFSRYGAVIDRYRVKKRIEQ